MLDIFTSSESKGQVEPPSDDGDDQRPCNETGHDWPEWTGDPFSPKAKSWDTEGHDLRVYTKMSRNCTKCDKYDNKNKTLGYVDVDDDGNLSVTNE